MQFAFTEGIESDRNRYSIRRLVRNRRKTRDNEATSREVAAASGMLAM
jgi:hypothetical protein